MLTTLQGHYKNKFTAGQTMAEPEKSLYPMRNISNDGASRSRIAADRQFNAHFQSFVVP